MRFKTVLNRDGGTLRTLDLDAFAAEVERLLGEAGHTVETEIVAGSEIEATLRAAAGEAGVDVVMVGGGDGTVSTAAGIFMNRDKALAILPAGTMNLFARGLGLPIDLEAAVAAHARGVVHAVDVASANGRPFVHQYSVGMHPQLVDLRDRMDFRSRLGKLLASFRAGLMTVLHPPRLSLKMRLDGLESRVVTSGIGITNNLFGEGHLPYAEMPDKGVLGVYVTRARRRRDFFLFFAYMAIGRWRGNPQVDIHETREVTLGFTSRTRRFKCAIDGELCPLEPTTTLRIHAGALKVLVPADALADKA